MSRKEDPIKSLLQKNLNTDIEDIQLNGDDLGRNIAIELENFPKLQDESRDESGPPSVKQQNSFKSAFKVVNPHLFIDRSVSSFSGSSFINGANSGK